MPPDYELSSHTRGVSLTYQNQINSQNLVSAQASYVTANSIRDNNSQMFNVTRCSGLRGSCVNAADPYSGYLLRIHCRTLTTCAKRCGQHAVLGDLG